MVAVMKNLSLVYKIFLHNVQKRFWKKVQKGSPNECWPWIGCKDVHGYGRIAILRVGILAHRISYEFAYGPIPEDKNIVRHRCDNPICVNPYHLEIGTIADNMRDKCERGRQLRGSAHGASKLNEDQVRQIKLRLSEGEHFTKISPDYGISWQAVKAIFEDRTWKHVKVSISEPEHPLQIERTTEMKRMKPKTKKAKKAKMKMVMDEYKSGKLHSGSKKGPKVKSRAQAIAIGLNQSGQSNKDGARKSNKEQEMRRKRLENVAM